MNAVVRIIMLTILVTGFLPGMAAAQTKPRIPTITGPAITGDIAKDIKTDFQRVTGTKATGDIGFDLLKMLDAKLLPDLTYAQKLADANGNKLTSNCWAAWISLIQTNENAVKNTDGTTQDPPDPHLVTTLERAIDIRNALQPAAPFMVACSPVANLIKTDVLNFIGQVVGGGLSLSKIVPLL